ncbi:hypothetical protein A2U01_0060675, partial [Trifolium medium]|nr:hypothetical protein [Trifolium medium]
ACIGATRSARVQRQPNLLVLVQRARGFCATRSVTLFFLFFFWWLRNAQGIAAQCAVL